MKFLGLTPMLQTEDIGATIAWYETVLGFQLIARLGDDWCHLRRDQAALMFMRNAHLGAPSATATQYMVLDDVLGLHAEVKDCIPIEWGPERMAYGMLEFAVRDNNGYLLSFGQEMDEV